MTKIIKFPSKIDLAFRRMIEASGPSSGFGTPIDIKSMSPEEFENFSDAPPLITIDLVLSTLKDLEKANSRPQRLQIIRKSELLNIKK